MATSDAEQKTGLSSGQIAGRWRVVPWFSARRRWGVDVRWRTPRAHSQLRVHLGRRHLTLQKVWRGGRSV